MPPDPPSVSRSSGNKWSAYEAPGDGRSFGKVLMEDISKKDTALNRSLNSMALLKHLEKWLDFMIKSQECDKRRS